MYNHATDRKQIQTTRDRDEKTQAHLAAAAGAAGRGAFDSAGAAPPFNLMREARLRQVCGIRPGGINYIAAQAGMLARK